MKRAVSVLWAAAIVVSAFFTTGCKDNSKSEFDDGVMRKEMTSTEYVSEMGLGINLGNTMEAYWANDQNRNSGSTVIGDNTISNYETCWGAIKTTQEIIDGMKNAGFNTVRVPVYWGNSMTNDGTFTISDAMFDRVEEIVDYCRKADLYVVIIVPPNKPCQKSRSIFSVVRIEKGTDFVRI